MIFNRKTLHLSYLEKIAVRVRHLPMLCKLKWLWNSVRPIYELTLKLFYRKGFLRSINDIGEIYISYECRKLGSPPAHELKWWERLIHEVKEGDTIVDIGAYIGLLTIMMAKKIGNTGKVIAFEPNPHNLALLKKNIKLNEVDEQTEVYDIALSAGNQPLTLTDEGPISHIIASTIPYNAGFFTVKSKSLDEIFHNGEIDILKIDTEGYEVNVFSGAKNLLKRKEGYPRFIFIECHPYMWKEFGVIGKTLETLLQQSGYTLEMPPLPDNNKLDDIKHHWVIFASKHK